MSQLWKCVADPDAVDETHQPEVRPNLTVAEHPVKILDHAEKALRNKVIPVKQSERPPGRPRNP